MSSKLVYFFGDGQADGEAGMKALLGGKGANLAEMTNIGVPVPPGFTISTEVCTRFYEEGGRLPDELESEMRQALAAYDDPDLDNAAPPHVPRLRDYACGRGFSELVRALDLRYGKEA